jgi:hypothetical protein
MEKVLRPEAPTAFVQRRRGDSVGLIAIDSRYRRREFVGRLHLRREGYIDGIEQSVATQMSGFFSASAW